MRQQSGRAPLAPNYIRSQIQPARDPTCCRSGERQSYIIIACITSVSGGRLSRRYFHRSVGSCPYAPAERGLLLVFPVITAGGRGLEVVGRNRSTAPQPVLPVHGVTTPSPLQSSVSFLSCTGLEQEINRKQFEWRNKFSVALPAVNWLRVAAPRRRRNLRMEAPSHALPTHAPVTPRQLGVFMSEKSVETRTSLGGS
uniref:SFRICE_004831 n=1 Tax=Spodoptera frugiperda TaxID=7108 RepID=A0A2H1VXS7_SPOFR